jgi:S1-C subfamily serine protease
LINRGTNRKWLVTVSFLLIVLASSIIAYSLSSSQATIDQQAKIQSLEGDVASLQTRISELQQAVPTGNPSINASIVGLNPVTLYNQDYKSVVTIRATEIFTVPSFFGPITSVAEILGSGFAITYNNSLYVVTNFHVVSGTSNTTVTFWDGDAYPASVVGSDPYADLAVVSVDAPSDEYHPLTIVPSTFLKVGQPVAAIGNPFGLAGSMTFGIISQLGRSLQEQTTGTVSISDVIQFSAPINPGNSGGPLLNAQGEVIGITTAIVGNSQGVGFAIPSDTVIREISSLITTGTYVRHPLVGASLVDMNYQLAQIMNSNITYGTLIESTVKNGPNDKAGLQAGDTAVMIQNNKYLIGGDIIISIDGTRIVNQTALSSYLAEKTLVGQTVQVGMIRDGNYTQMPVVLGQGPGPQGTV